MSKKTAFLDTNVLLHSIPLRQINWTQLLGADEVELVVSPIVADELEEKKYDPQRWVQERADKANAQLQEIGTDEVRPGVRLVFADKEVGAAELKAFNLLWERNDDRILGCALAYRGGDKSDLVVVSRDNAFLNRARTQGFDTRNLGKDYLLPLAPDPMELRAKRAEAQVKEMKDKNPKLKLVFAGGATQLVAKMRQKPADAIGSGYLTEMLQARESLPPLRGLSVEAIHEYNGKIAQYGLHYSSFSNEQGQAEELLGRMQRIELVVQNDGVTPAKGVKLTMKLPAEVESIEPQVRFPLLPVYPRPSPEFDPDQLYYPNMPKLRARPSRLADPTPHDFGVDGISLDPLDPKQMTYKIERIEDRSSKRLGSVDLLFQRGVLGKAVLEYTLTAAGVFDKYTGELAIVLERDES